MEAKANKIRVTAYGLAHEGQAAVVVGIGCSADPGGPSAWQFTIVFDAEAVAGIAAILTAAASDAEHQVAVERATVIYSKSGIDD